MERALVGSGGLLYETAPTKTTDCVSLSKSITLIISLKCSGELHAPAKSHVQAMLSLLEKLSDVINSDLLTQAQPRRNALS